MRDETRAKIEKYINSIDGGVYLAQKKDYRPKSLPIDDIWSYIPKEYSFIAKDKDDLIYRTEDGKLRAIVEETKKYHEKGL